MEAIVFYLLKSAGILAIFFISYQLFLKNETFFRTNRHFLLGGILASVLLPLVIFTNYVYIDPVETFNPDWFFSDLPTSNIIVEQAEPFNWFKLATYVYILGLTVFGIRFAIQLASLFKLFKNHTIFKKDGFYLVKVNTDMSPFSFFNYIVYNPKKYNFDDLQVIINHEKVHSNQLHSIDILLSQLFVILQWFNPLAWFYRKSIQQNLEFMADKYAVSKSVSAKHYQHTLLKASLKPKYASITNNFYNSLIEKRLIMLNQSKSNIKNSWKYFTILPALALFLMSFNVKTVEIEKPTIEPSSSLENGFSSTLSTNIFLQDIIEKKIDKNTTDNQLHDIAKSLKSKGIEFCFKNVKRNSSNEITGINITYKDADGNTGNYALSSDNPINTFYFFKEENGRIGFKSENNNAEFREKTTEARKEAKAKRAEMMKERKEEMEVRRQEIEERRAEIEVRVDQARKQQQKAREQQRKNYKFIVKERKPMKDSLKSKRQVFINGSDLDNDILYILDGDEAEMEDIKLLSPNQIESMNVFKGDKALKIYGDKGKNGVVVITSKHHGKNVFEIEVDEESTSPNFEFVTDTKLKWTSADDNNNVNIIKKSTTDAELNRMKSILKLQNIDFKFSKLKRNKLGEITRIKVSLNDNNGNKSSSFFDKGDQTISPVLIGKNKDNLIIKQFKNL